MKFYSLLLLLLFCACSSSNKIISKSGIEEIQFGSGGGVVGTQSVYVLKPDSKLYADGEEIKTLDQNLTFEIFQKAKNLKGYQYQTPSNIYSYIEITTSKDRINRIVWMPKDPKVDKKVVDLHQQLNSLIKL